MSQNSTSDKFDVLGFILKVEDGRFDPTDEDDVKSLQNMVDSGLIWQLQGWWQRFARQMITQEIIFIR